MDYSQIIRNLITAELYDRDEFIFQMNLLFFYDLEDRLYRNPDLNAYFKQIIPKVDIYNLYTDTISGEHNILFKTDFDKRIQNYLELDPTVEDNLEELVVPIHQIFYRFFIKGGAALKVFVDNLDKLGIIGNGMFIPGIANSPTDIDTNLLVNPKFQHAAVLLIHLKKLVKSICLELIDKYAKIYWEIDKIFIEKLQNNESFINNISDIYHTDNPIYIDLPVEDHLLNALPNNGETIKPQNSPIRLTTLHPNHMDIMVFRLLLCINITDVRYNLEKTESSELGIPLNRILINGEGELIDITIYELTNPKYNEIWEWAKNAMPFGPRYTLFQGIHDMIIDLIQMSDVKGNPSLIDKAEKRQIRLNFLYLLYCNYRMIQNILENSNKIKQEHIVNYCSKFIEPQFFTLGLTQAQIHLILPYIIGYNGFQFEHIMFEFILNYIYHSQNIQYKLDFNPSSILFGSKLIHNDLENEFPKKDLEKIKKYILTIFALLPRVNQASVFVKLVSLYDDSKNDGNTSLILLTAIARASNGNALTFSDRVLNNYRQLLKSVMTSYQSLFISKMLLDAYRQQGLSNVQYSRLILNENVGKMCATVLNGLVPAELQIEMAILNKYPPYKIIYFPKKNDINLLILFENVVRLLATYFNELPISFFMVYEIINEYTIEIFYRLPAPFLPNSTTDIKFCRLSMNKIVSYTNMIKMFENSNKTLYQLMR